MFVAKYNIHGTLVWVKRYEVGGLDVDIDMCTDGSSLITGYYYPSDTKKDVFIAKIEDSGVLEWIQSAEGPGDDTARGVKAFQDCSAVITGGFLEKITFGKGSSRETTLRSAGAADIFIARYEPDGSLEWAKSAGGDSPDSGEDIDVYSDGSFVLTGSFSWDATFGQGEEGETHIISNGRSDVFISGYDTAGNLTWIKNAGGGDFDQGNGITIAPDDSILCTGYFYLFGTFGINEPNETVLSSEGYEDIFIAKLAP